MKFSIDKTMDVQPCVLGTGNVAYGETIGTLVNNSPTEFSPYNGSLCIGGDYNLINDATDIVPNGCVCWIPASFSNVVGDPHFVRWKHKHRDSFHGECDLALLSNSLKQLFIHFLRATIPCDEHSFIDTVAIAIGQHQLEIEPTHVEGDDELLTDQTTFPLTVALEDNEDNEKDDDDSNSNSMSYVMTIDQVGKKKYKITWNSGAYIIVRGRHLDECGIGGYPSRL